MDLLREPHPTSQIAQERVGPGPPSLTFVALAIGMGLVVCGVAAYVGLHPRGAFTVESAAAGNPGSLYLPLGIHAARAASALAAGAAVAALAYAARRLTHSDAVGLLAGAILALDPAFLANARLATPEALAVAALIGALACFLSIAGWTHWLGAGLLTVAALVDPRTLFWAIPLFALAVLRGHIYAAPRHLGRAALQTVAAPLAGAILNLSSGAPGLAFLPCPQPASQSLLLLQSPSYGAVAAVHDPVTWFGGLGALVLLSAGALVAVLSQVRMARLPGRLQLRLSQPLSGPQSRTLWLLALAVTAPFPAIWLVVFAIALAMGIGELADDAPGFGVAVALAVVVYSVLALVRAWTLVSGSGDAAGVAEAASGLVPWGTLVGCP